MAKNSTSKGQKSPNRPRATKPVDPNARTKHVKFLVNEEEDKMLHDMCSTSGLNQSNLLRQIIRQTYKASGYPGSTKSE